MKRLIGLLAVVAIAGTAAATVGRVGRDAMPALDSLPDWAGGRPDVAGCERYIGTGLAAPATYRRVSVIHVDSGVLDQATFDREAGITAPARRPRPIRDELDRTLAAADRLEAMQVGLERERAAGHALRLRRVMIDYDADNAAGVPIRATAICMFRLIDGKLDDQAEIARRADRAGDPSIDAPLLYLGREPRRRATGATPCCL